MITTVMLLLISLVAGAAAYNIGVRDGIARANAIARDEHAADGFHVSEETQP